MVAEYLSISMSIFIDIIVTEPYKLYISVSQSVFLMVIIHLDPTDHNCTTSLLTTGDDLTKKELHTSGSHTAHCWPGGSSGMTWGVLL